MGRITIFTTEDCDDCLRTKAAFFSRFVPYVDVNLTMYPERRRDMMSLSRKRTVPQVFFNDQYVGGADKALSILLKWDAEASRHGSPRERYQRDIVAAPDPSDNRLAPPFGVPANVPPRPPRDAMRGMIELPHDRRKSVSVLEITTYLMKFLPRADLTWRGKVYHQCFKGTDGVLALMKCFQLPDKHKIIEFGRELQKRHIIDHVCSEHKFGDTGKYFRLQPFHVPGVLNSFCVWNDTVDPLPMRLVSKLHNLLNKVVCSVKDSDGLVDYAAAERHPGYTLFEEAVCELQGVDISAMEEKTRKAFCINIYNLMITHAYIKIGIPGSALQRGSFFRNVCYDIGGVLLSSDDIEHGILRANGRHPKLPSAMCSSDETRMRLALTHLDPRIHFAINWGSNFGQPLKPFSAECIEEELDVAARDFCTNNDNVIVDADRCEISLSLVFHWYQSDFVDSTSKLPGYILEFLTGTREKKLLHILTESRGSCKIKWIKPFDWMPTGYSSKSFERRISSHPQHIRRFSTVQ